MMMNDDSSVDSGSEEEPQPSTHRASNRSGRPSKAKKTQSKRRSEPRSVSPTPKPANFGSAVTDMVKLIIQYGSTEMPFKRADLVKHVLNGEQKHYKVIFEETCKELLDIYGLIVNEIQNKSGGIMYYLSNKHSVCSELEYRRQQKKERTLLIIILAYVFMKNGHVADCSLKNFLEKLNINCEEEDENFGFVQNTIMEKFVKQHYITLKKFEVEGTHNERNVIDWGQRAEREFDKKEVLKTVAKLLKRPPVSFIAQYQEVFGELNVDNIEDLMEAQATQAAQSASEDEENQHNEAMEVDESGDDE